MSASWNRQIPFKGGDEYDYLTRVGRRVHACRYGQARLAKRGYQRRVRAYFRAILRKMARQMDRYGVW